MAEPRQKPAERALAREQGLPEDGTFKRNGPEPPENDSGPSPSVEELERRASLRGGTPFKDRQPS
jgi:hypothetical protein